MAIALLHHSLPVRNWTIDHLNIAIKQATELALSCDIRAVNRSRPVGQYLHYRINSNGDRLANVDACRRCMMQ